ncbi:hypothetical protein AAC387_Pa11g2094 [Persea americana]
MASPSADVFDAYFRMADLDKDGRISGAEAVVFLQRSNLPKHVLAQIWTHADQNHAGFLGRVEFYNALKLVTVAQSGRELTPDMVKAALFGPAAAKIPAPKINSVATPTPHSNTVTPPTPPTSQMSAVAPTASQNLGFRGPQTLQSTGMNQHFFPSSDNQLMRPHQVSPASSLTMQATGQGLPGAGNMMGPRPPNSNSSNLSSDWFGARPAGASVGATPQTPNRGVSPSMTQDGFAGVMPSGSTPSMPPRPQTASGLIPSTQDGFGGFAPLGPTSSIPPRPQTPSGQMPSLPSKPQDAVQSLQTTVNDSKALTVSGNGFSSDIIFGGDVFSATPSQPKQDVSTQNLPAGSVPASSAVVPVATEPQSSVKQGQVDPFQSFAMTTTSSQLQRPVSQAKTAPGVSVGAAGSSPGQTQLQWPRITQSDIQKYTKVFVEVDTDRDGKITGEQARNLFLSWRLPREVLKQVWDLSDQDNDSMLSRREFCTALFLMERYREGRPLPPVLPDSIRFDETLLRETGQPVAAYGWRSTPGMPQQGFSGARPGPPAAGSRQPAQVPIPPQTDGAPEATPQKSRVPVLEKHLVNQLSTEEQSSLNSKFQEATDADKKVEQLEKDILDSREKIEFYRTKMQELVLYKSRCDNRLNEITERVSADKREAELLAKKYEEKYKQVGGIASRLTVEEATFRDIQERKMELYNAIIKMEQGGSADGLLQVRVDRVQSDLEGLVKALNERCKKYGLRAKPTALIELPFGWQPGIQEGAADWNEDWDKFEDEGFTIVKDLSVDVENIVAPPRPARVWNDKTSTDEAFGGVSSSNGDSKTEKPSSTDERVPEGGSPYAKSEDDLARSPPGSPKGKSSLESPSQEFPSTYFVTNASADASPRMKESQSDHDGAESTVSGYKFDEPSWGATFDASDDTDSIWGTFNPIKTKESDHELNKHNSFFGSGELGLNSIRTDSPDADSLFQKKDRSPFFADSVPSTPLFNSSSPPRYSGEDHTFDSFTRFNSFSMNDGGLFPPPESFARFDSIRSNRDSDRSRGFPSFDDADPFGATGPFKSSESQTPRRESDRWSAF